MEATFVRLGCRSLTTTSAVATRELVCAVAPAALTQPSEIAHGLGSHLTFYFVDSC